MERYDSLSGLFSYSEDENLCLRSYEDEIFLLTLNHEINIQDALFSMRTDTFILLVIEKGVCDMRINYVPHRIGCGMFIVLREGLWVSDVKVSDDFMAYAVIVKRDFMRSAMGTNVFPVRDLFNHRLLFPVMSMERDDFGRVMEYIKQLERNLLFHSHHYQRSLIQNALCNINLELWDITARQMSVDTRQEERMPTMKEKLAFLFIYQVHKCCRTDHEVAAYADKLNVSPAHLTRTVKEVTGKTASEWIAESLTNEIRFLLHHPENSIQSIAFQVQFSDQAALSKFFKKNTGMSPLEYRRMIKERKE